MITSPSGEKQYADLRELRAMLLSGLGTLGINRLLDGLRTLYLSEQNVRKYDNEENKIGSEGDNVDYDRTSDVEKIVGNTTLIDDNSIMGDKSGVKYSESLKITWGECLLLLLPDSDSYFRRHVLLTSSDNQGLKKAGVFDDECWGLVPLKISDSNIAEISGIANSDTDTKMGFCALEPSALQKEVDSMHSTPSNLTNSNPNPN